jgi:hypothetical protein
MKTLLLILVLSPLLSTAHPGVGIVKDSKGNIYYTDLHQVWKITNGNKTIVVPNVHTHELYIDQDDNLYGEGGDYDATTKTFYHYLWIYRSDGILDTIVNRKEAYVVQDFSLARDTNGNEYYIKKFLHQPDTSHVYIRTRQGNERIFATGNFKDVNWLHPQDDGTLLYVSKNSIFRIEASGHVQLIKENIGNAKPSFEFSGNRVTIWGVWQDKMKNTYAAVLSDQAVKKIDRNGTVTIAFKSQGNWAPLHGLFDNNNTLWVLESSDKNDVRVIHAIDLPIDAIKKKPDSVTFIILSIVIVGCVISFLILRILMSKKLSAISLILLMGA